MKPRLLAILLLNGSCASKFILHPTTDALPCGGAQRRMIDRPGLPPIEVLIDRSPGCSSGAPALFDLEFTGNATRAEDVASAIARRWGERPVEVWVMNYPGYGQSAGPAELSAIAPASLGVFDAMRMDAGPRPVIVGGHSLGTTAALCVAARRPVAGLFLVNSPPLRQLILGRFGWWNLWLIALPVADGVPVELDSVANAKMIHAPAVFITAGQDRLVPPEYQRQVYDAFAGPGRLVVIDGANHSLFVDPQTQEGVRDGMDWLYDLAVKGR